MEEKINAIGRPKKPKGNVAGTGNITDTINGLLQRQQISEEKIENQLKEAKEQKVWVTGGFIVLCFTVAAMLVGVGAIFNDYIAMKQATYQSLKDEVNETNIKNQQILDKLDELNLNTSTTTKQVN